MNLGLRELMRLSDVRRWHTVAVAREQTLADHSCRVALIALRLYWYQVGQMNKTDMATLLMTALLHDAAEIHLGDLPPAGKTAEYLVLEGGCMKSMMIGLCLDEQPNAQITATVKVADRIEAWLWIQENAVGEHSRHVAERCYRGMERVAAEFKMTDAAISTIMEITGKEYSLCPF